jgi:hypothetical protein
LEKEGAVMTATSRRSRNYKEKSSMFAFGHFALPIAALIAVGLLFVGIKLFFLTPEPVGKEVDINVIESPAELAGGDIVLAEASPEVIPAPTTPPVERVIEIPEIPEIPPMPAIGPLQPSATVKAAPPKQTPAPTSASRRNRTPARAGGRWAVQIGAFKSPEGANATLDQVKKDGYEASISKAELADGTFYRVRVSAGNTRGEANRIAAELEKKKYPVLVLSSR